MATLLLEDLFRSANQQAGIETSALRGIIERANLPADIGTGTSGDSTRSFLIKRTPASDISITTPDAGDTGAWSDWTTIEESDPITASQAGNCIILSNLYIQYSGTPSGGGDRATVEGRIMRIRGGDSEKLEDSRDHGPRSLPANSGQTSVEFSNASKEMSKILAVLAELETGDIVKIEARIIHQVTSGTRTFVLKSDENFLEIANWSANPTGQGGRTDSEINGLITTFLNALPSGSITALKTQLSIHGDTDINNLIHTYLNALSATDISVLKTALGIKTDAELRQFIEDDLDTETIKRVLSNIPNGSVNANFLKDIAINFGDTLPTNTTNLPDGMLFLNRSSGLVYVLIPSQRTAVTNRNRATVTIANDIFILSNNLFMDNPNDLIGRIENKPTNNSRQFELFLREDLLDDLGINSTQDNAVKLYVDIGGTTIGLHRYAGNTERVLYPDILENVRWIPFESPVGTTVTLTNGQRTNILFYRDSAKTQAINIKPEYTYSARSFRQVTGEHQPDLSNYLTQNQIEALIRSNENIGDPLTTFTFAGTAGSIDRNPVKESSALTNTFLIDGVTYTIKKIYQLDSDRDIHITTSPSPVERNQPDASGNRLDNSNIVRMHGLKIKINSLILSFDDAVGGINDAGYNADFDNNEVDWTFNGRPANSVIVGSNSVEVYEPLGPENYVPEGGTSDDGKVLKWNQANKEPEWQTESALDASVSSKIEKVENFEDALRYTTPIGTRQTLTFSAGQSVSSLRRVPALDAGSDQRIVVNINNVDHEFSLDDLYALPRVSIGSVLNNNDAIRLQTPGDSVWYWIGRQSGSQHYFLFSGSDPAAYDVAFSTSLIDVQDAARASSTPLPELIEDTMTGVLTTPSSDLAVNHIDASNKIELNVKDGVLEPSNLRGDTVFGDRMVVTDASGSSFRFLSPNQLIHNSALNLYRVTDVDNARPWVAFSPTFYNNTQAGHYVMDLYFVRGGTGGNVNIKFNEFGDSTITVSATTFTQTITRSAVKTLSNFAGVPVVRQQIWEGTTLIGELGFYLARASDHSLGYWERWRWKPGYAHQNKSFNLTRYLTLSFSANVS